MQTQIYKYYTDTYVYKHMLFLLILFEDVTTNNKYWGNVTAYLKIQVIYITPFYNLPYFNQLPNFLWLFMVEE